MKIIQGFAYLFICLIAFAGCSNEDSEVVAAQSLDFSVSPTSIDFGASGGNSIVNINSETEWTITGGGDWIQLSKNSDAKTAKITLKTLANTDTIARSSTVVVSTGGMSQEIIINQQGAKPEPSDEIVFEVEPDSTGMSNLSSVDFVNQMSIGWNVGNTLDAIGGETAWGNPMITQELIDNVKAAGFDAVRIPVAWSKFSNEAEFTIDEAWMNRVEEVVNYVVANDMYAVLNIHWDGGWMQPTNADKDYVNNRLEIMWTQIARNFRDYGDHLLFAGTNEVMVEGNYNTPTEEYYTVQNSFNQTFVDAVRATGGKNVFRYLVVQGFNTNIDHTVNFAEIPEDVRENRLAMEVHYYDPYNFTLNENSEITQWGAAANDPTKVESWANESYVDAQMAKMKTNFIDKGIGVILGEYGAISRTDIPGHSTFRKNYLKYVTKAASDNNLVPFYWDNGDQTNHGFALFNRSTGNLLEPDLVQTMVNAVSN